VKAYAITSMIPEVVITADIGTALLENLRRLEQWWAVRLATLAEWNSLANVGLVWSAETGAIPADPELALVQVVASLPNAPQDIAYHTTDAVGRPLCLVSWSAVQAEGGTLTGPDGLVSAISHEIQESRVDPSCNTLTPLPGDNSTGDISTPLEVCDWVQGSDYVEPCSPGIYLANAVGPRFFLQGATGKLDTRSDVTAGAVSEAFQLLPEGYYEQIQGAAVSNVYGARVSWKKHARLERTGPRGGAVRAARKAS
jgi:hypothetical protein